MSFQSFPTVTSRRFCPLLKAGILQSTSKGLGQRKLGKLTKRKVNASSGFLHLRLYLVWHIDRYRAHTRLIRLYRIRPA